MKLFEMIRRTLHIWLAQFHWNRFVHYSTLKNKDEMKDAIKHLRNEVKT